MSTLPANAGQKILAYTRITNELGQRVAADQQVKQAAEEVRPGLVKKAVDALVANGRIKSEQHAAVSAALQGANGYNSALELLEKLAVHRNDKERVEAIGNEIPGKGSTKQAGYNGPLGAHVANYDERPSGQAFRARILGQG